MDSPLSPLLDYLHSESPRRTEDWRGWRITPVADTVSGRTYLVEGGDVPLGVKFATRDHLDRAGTEYGCLSALQATIPGIAPEPVLLERDRYSRPGVVRTWLSGEVVEDIPEDERSWEAILGHFLAVHSLTPETVPRQTVASVPVAALTALSAGEVLTLLGEHLARELPPDERPGELSALVEEIEGAEYPYWESQAQVLCHGDPNRYNFLLRRDAKGLRCLSIDWEYGGWGDPAFEIANLISAPTMVKMPEERKEWLITGYAARSSDETVATRIRAYYPVVLAWWAVRFARFLVETPPGDEELRKSAGAVYNRYLSMAKDALL